MWMEQKKRCKKGQLRLETKQNMKMARHLAQLLLSLGRENCWYLFISRWMVVWSHRILWASCTRREKPVSVPEVADSQEDIHRHLREMEVQCPPEVGYMKKQPDVPNSRRAVLVGWSVKIGEEYKAQDETLHLAVNCIPGFFSPCLLAGHLQLGGATAVLLASKFEEMHPRSSRVCAHHR